MLRIHNSWPTTLLAKKLRYLAEASAELLSDSSWDSYKVYTLSTSNRLREIVIACNQVDAGEFPKPTIEPMIDEYNYCAESDPVFRDCVGRLGKAEHSIKLDFKETTREIRNRASLLMEVTDFSYKTCCEKLIEKSILDDPKFSKSSTQLLLKLYFSYLINLGYSKAYIRSVLVDKFLTRDIRRCSRGMLQDFFQQFPDEKRSFTIYAIVENKFAKIAKDSLNLTLFSNAAALQAAGRPSLPDKVVVGPKQAILVFDRVEDYDRFSAVVGIERVFSLIQSFIFLQRTYYRPKSPSKFFVLAGKRRSGFICDSARSDVAPNAHVPMRTLVEGSRKLTRLVFGDDPGQGSAIRLMRAVNTAALAGKTESKEAQLITLWAAFEALLPQARPGEDVRILHFCRYIVPGVCMRYPHDHIAAAYKDLSRLFRDRFYDFLDERTEDEDRLSQFNRILFSEDDARVRALFQIASLSELAAYRIFDLRKKLHSCKLFAAMCAAHEKRVFWQLQRIYRERNLIVHSGRTSPFLEGLIENSYSYFATMIDRLESISQAAEVRRLDAAVTALKIVYDGQCRDRERLSERAKREAKSEREVISLFLAETATQAKRSQSSQSLP